MLADAAGRTMSLHVSGRNGGGRGAVGTRPILMMVTDRARHVHPPAVAQTGEPSWAGLVTAAATAARAGVGFVQVRERGPEDASPWPWPWRFDSRSPGTGARMIVNDRIDVALAAGAAGAHLPRAAVTCDRLRAMVPDDFLVGRSVHSVAEAIATEATGGCDDLFRHSVRVRKEQAGRTCGGGAGGARRGVRGGSAAGAGHRRHHAGAGAGRRSGGRGRRRCDRIICGRRRTGAPRCRRPDSAGVRVTLSLIRGASPLGLPCTRSARRFAGALRSRGSLAAARSRCL